MNYYQLRQDKLPIGSGPVEAGCKTLIKGRLGGSGMRWLITGADDMLISRSHVLSDGRFDQYWQKRMQYGTNQLHQNSVTPCLWISSNISELLFFISTCARVIDVVMFRH